MSKFHASHHTVYPKKYAHGFCFAVLCCGYTLTDFPISIKLTSRALWQSDDCPSASKATLMNMDKYFIWIHYERLHNHNKAKHNKTVCIFLGIYCILKAADFTIGSQPHITRQSNTLKTAVTRTVGSIKQLANSTKDMRSCTWGSAHRKIGVPVVCSRNNPCYSNGTMAWLRTSLCQLKDSVYFIRKPFGVIIGISGMMC